MQCIHTRVADRYNWERRRLRFHAKASLCPERRRCIHATVEPGLTAVEMLVFLSNSSTNQNDSNLTIAITCEKTTPTQGITSIISIAQYNDSDD